MFIIIEFTLPPSVASSQFLLLGLRVVVCLSATRHYERRGLPKGPFRESIYSIVEVLPDDFFDLKPVDGVRFVVFCNFSFEIFYL